MDSQIPYVTVSQVAAQEECPPRWISDMLYRRHVDLSRCPLVGRVRLIPRDLLPSIREQVQQMRERLKSRQVPA